MDFNSNTQTSDLSLEQQFSIKSFESQVRQMSLQQSQDFLIEMYTHMLLKEQAYKDLIKKDWGLV